MAIITIDKLSKLYHLGDTVSHSTLRDTIVHTFKGLWSSKSSAKTDELWALKDISLEVQQGEVLGIIGRNGAGKSTLLKILSRITDPTHGEIVVRGRLGSLLEVGTGFHPELSGRENIFLNGAILGMSQAEIARKFDEIVAFAEVEQFLDTPVKRYSSGMYVRLAFAVAAHLEPDVLVVDEVLAVGDAGFQKKCISRMGAVAKGGRTVLFVSHNLSTVSRLCTKCVMLAKGQIAAYGDTQEVIEYYLRSISQSDDLVSEKLYEPDPKKAFQVLAVRLFNDRGKLASHFNCDEGINITITAQARVKVPGLYGFLSINDRNGETIIVSDTYDFLPNVLDSLQPAQYEMKLRIPPRTLGHGDYVVSMAYASSQSPQGFHLDVPRETCYFRLDDFTSNRGNRRPGYFSTLLPWDVTPIEGNNGH